jgi:hypothetical protein
MRAITSSLLSFLYFLKNVEYAMEDNDLYHSYVRIDGTVANQLMRSIFDH